MNQAVPCLESKGEIQRATEKKRFLKVERKVKKKIINQEFMVWGRVTLLREMEGIYQQMS